MPFLQNYGIAVKKTEKIRLFMEVGLIFFLFDVYLKEKNCK